MYVDVVVVVVVVDDEQNVYVLASKDFDLAVWHRRTSIEEDVNTRVTLQRRPWLLDRQV